jgi:hypothetical protein
MLQHDVQFQWEPVEMKAIAIVNKPLRSTLALKTLDVNDGIRQTVLEVNIRLERWGAIILKEDDNTARHQCQYDSGLWNKLRRDNSMGNMNAVD